ncbi:MAG: VWA domain-containing protein [Cellvibrio sp.]|nr:VWA domain-containing protein [Cellvibrio sp.]
MVIRFDSTVTFNFFTLPSTKNAGQWQQLIAPHLLPFLLEGKTVKTPRGYLLVLLFAWILSTIALAGPSWTKAPVAVEKNDKALVILLDLSPSMLTEDIKPSRIVRARLKIADLLRERPDGQTALLVYAADAHVVTPLTDDAKTINNLLPMLSPKLMPAQGSNTEAAVTRAIKLLTDAGLQQGDLLLITDGVEIVAQKTINELLKQHPRIRLSILGVGGKEPAPIPSNNGGFVRDRSNNIITSYLDINSLRNFAENNRGRYKTLSSDVKDMQVFTSLASMEILDADKKETSQKSNRQFDQWTDEGHWLVFLLLPIIAYAFRRGVLLSLFLVPFLLVTPEKTYALGWDELWKNQDQRAYEKLQADKAAEAAKEFTQPDWQASAEYKAGNFAEAATKFSTQNSATGHYNRANALAKSGKLEEAIKAYDKALSLDANLEDAKKNRKIVEDALKKQQEQQNNQDQNQQDQNNSDQQKQDQQDQQQKKQDQQNQNQQDQNSDQQKSDQQQNSSSGQNSYNQNQSQENASQSSQGNQSQMDSQTSSSAASQMNQAAQTSSAQSEEQKSDEQKEAEAKALAEMQKDGLTEEERKNLEQWLRRVQDDPSGLLRRKFEYEYRKQQSEKYKGTWESPENEADQRL